MRKRIISLLLAGVMLGAMTVPAFAEEETKTLEKNGTDQDMEGSTDVEGEVSEQEPGSPSYVITIPSKIDFGLIHQPATNVETLINIPFDVTASNFVNMAEGMAVAVLLRDSEDTQTLGEWSGNFQIKKGENSLAYNVINPESKDFADLKKDYNNGILFNVFAAEGTAKGAAKLNAQQLFGKDLDQWKGTYSGRVQFYSKIVELRDYQ